MSAPSQLQAVEEAREQVEAAMRMRGEKCRRGVLYPTRTLDRLIHAFNELAAVKFDLRANAFAEAAETTRRVQSRLVRIAGTVPGDVAEHLLLARDRLDVFGGESS